MKGVEPSRPKALPPEDSVYTNFTTCAAHGYFNKFKNTYISSKNSVKRKFCKGGVVGNSTN